jgi:predicted RNA-binding Zn ribbon-like protein
MSGDMATKLPAPSGKNAAELIVDFVNTAELDEDRDDVGTPEALAGWLGGEQLAPAGTVVAPAEHARAIAVREAIRDLLGTHNGFEADEAAATAILDDAARRAGLGVRFRDAGAALEPEAAGADPALGLVLAAVAATMADGTWERLKACRDETCRWAFLDTAKNRSRAWCSMRSCGNRAKVRAYRDRTKGDG